MSLHLANLSHRIRYEDVLRVFRRFGQCSVQLEIGFGFVDYDLQGDAEKALRSLNGKKICDQPMKISWSKKQPKPLQGFVNPACSHDGQYGRNYYRGVNDVRLNFSRSPKDFSARNKHPDDHRGTRKSTERRHVKGSFSRNNMGVEPYKQRQESLEEGGQVVQNQVDYDRWYEQCNSLRSGNDLDGQMRSDRYEPDNGEERSGKSKDFAPGRLAGSPYRETSLVDNKMVHHRYNTRSHQGCFKCGAAGHKMHDCPLEDASHGKNSYHSDRSLENQDNTKARGRDVVGGQELRSVERLSSCSRKSISAKRCEADRKPLTVDTYRVKGCSSPVLSESRGNMSKDYNRKRQKENEDQILDADDDKKSRISCPSPELGTHSLMKAFPDPSVRSGSRSPVSHFCSPSSMSKSRSNQSRSRSMKSMSRSRSPNSALPLSLHRSLTSSPNSFERSLNDPYVDNARNQELKELPDSQDDFPTSINYHALNVNASLKDDGIPQSENVVLEKEVLCRPESNKVFECQITNASIESEHVSFSTVAKSSLLEQGDKDNTGGEIAAEKQRENEELDNANTLEIPNSLESANKVTLKASSKLGNHLSISKEELCMVLKHYGLRHLKHSEQHLDIEDYFGSARMWPWEMIYYRRQKKGLISKKNYTRRVAQNTAFGIDDKYVRSSSGWGELIDEHS